MHHWNCLVVSVQGLTMQACMNMCEDTEDCACIDNIDGCHMFKSGTHTNARYASHETQPFVQTAERLSELGLTQLVVPSESA